MWLVAGFFMPLCNQGEAQLCVYRSSESGIEAGLVWSANQEPKDHLQTERSQLRDSEGRGWHADGGGITAAVAISSPFCLHTAGRRLGRPWTISWLYNLIIAYRLKM